MDENIVPRQGKEGPEQQHRPGPNIAKHARHPSESPPKRVLSWGQRTNKVILGAGALATAITAIIALVLSLIPKHSDQNTAHFISIRPLRVESVTDYLQQSTAWEQSQERITVGTAASPCANAACMGMSPIIDRSCTKVNGQPASLRACVYDIATWLYGSASTLNSSGSVGIQPLGELVSVDMEIAGLKGQSVSLSWSIFPQNAARHLSGKWLQDYPAYRLEPTTNDDTGSLEMWIPMPKQPGPYFVRLALTVNGDALASSESGPFN